MEISLAETIFHKRKSLDFIDFSFYIVKNIKKNIIFDSD